MSRGVEKCLVWLVLSIGLWVLTLSWELHERPAETRQRSELLVQLIDRLRVLNTQHNQDHPVLMNLQDRVRLLEHLLANASRETPVTSTRPPPR